MAAFPGLRPNSLLCQSNSAASKPVLIGSTNCGLRFCTSAAIAESAASSSSKTTGSWTWNFATSPRIHFKEHKPAGAAGAAPILFLPTVSDVSTTEEWEDVASRVTGSCSGWRAVTVDWPGFGLSDRPALDYTADLMEKFLLDFVTAADGPLGAARTPPVIVGAGHAATIAVKAVAKGRLNARAMVTIAPTWAGPLPIVFGRSPEAESRYGLLRNAMRAPALGWAMYNVLVSSPGNIRKQYESHVYAKASNVSEQLVSSRLALTRREGARYAPAAFLTGKLDPCTSREEFLGLFGELQLPTMVLFSTDSPKRSRAEMEALRGARGVSKFVDIPGALLPHEEFPALVAESLGEFLREL